MSDERPVGIFDSGLGGLSVLKNLITLLPDETFVYFADSGYCPYGSKSVQAVEARSRTITEFLTGEDVKMVVVACNTATAAAIDYLRSTYPLPFIGIEPAIKQAALHTRSGKVGVLATQNTFQGRLFRETSTKYANDKDVMIRVGHGLVEMVEEDTIDTAESQELLRSYIEPMIDAGVDQIVLGCTHYPFLIPKIREMVPGSVVIHDPSPAVARQTAKILGEFNILSSGPRRKAKYYTTGDLATLKRFLKRLEFPEGIIEYVDI